MAKTKIDWCDMSFNPVSGCLHGCDYCYAMRDINRFKNNPKSKKVGGVLYPFGTLPTFHPERLLEKMPKKPCTVFIGSISDLFGDWSWKSTEKNYYEPMICDDGSEIPIFDLDSQWVIKQILDYCQKYPEHIFLFLTKEPAGMIGFDFPENCICGVTITIGEDFDRVTTLSEVTCKHKFVSFEPIFDPEAILNETKEPIFDCIDWVILGILTGKGSKKVYPPSFNRNLFLLIHELANVQNQPLFVKENVYKIFPEWKKYKQFPAIINNLKDKINAK